MSTAVKAAGRKRLAAIVAVLLVAGVVVATVGRVVNEPLRVAGELLLVVVAVGGAWVALTTTKARRGTAVIVTLAAVVALIVSVINAEGYRITSVVVRIVSLVVAVALAKYALGTTVGALKQSETEGTPVPAATRGVLFMNLKSGGGKAERFHLVDECTRRGIQPVVLEPGQDWLQVVRDVAASGVDVLGMAGGDGSQAMVGTVAVEVGLPMVVVPAGTRNHLALDLGLDRDDVVGALDGYGEAVERTMDLADVNGHVFVNNVSLGLYAAIVRSAAYRDAKVDTTLATLPQVLGPQSEPFDLRYTGADGAGATRRPHHPDLQQPLRHHVRWPGEPASDGHPSARCRGVGAGQAGRRRSVPGRPRIRPSGALRRALVVGDTDVRGHVRCPDRDGTRWRDQGHGLAAAFLDPPVTGPRATPEACHRLLAGRPLARLAEVPAPVVGDRPRYDPHVSDVPDRGSRVSPEERLAEVIEAHPTPRRSVAAQALHELAQVDLAVYRAIAGTPTPTLDEPLRRLSGLANHSKLWLGAAAALFALGGPRGRGAAVTGLVAVGINSAVVNLPMKLASRRERPDREAAEVPDERHVPMPTSTSFPSGHSASAFAFAGAVAGSIPVLGAPLRGLATAVAYSRVHTGVHYPGDVIVGSVVGATIGEATALGTRALRRRRDRPSGHRRQQVGELHVLRTRPTGLAGRFGS